jgi:hypothetical protein
MSLTKRLPPEERFGLMSQMRRAAVSIGSAIWEGCGRRHGQASSCTSWRSPMPQRRSWSFRHTSTRRLGFATRVGVLPPPRRPFEYAADAREVVLERPKFRVSRRGPRSGRAVRRRSGARKGRRSRPPRKAAQGKPSFSAAPRQGTLHSAIGYYNQSQPRRPHVKYQFAISSGPSLYARPESWRAIHSMKRSSCWEQKSPSRRATLSRSACRFPPARYQCVGEMRAGPSGCPRAGLPRRRRDDRTTG